MTGTAAGTTVALNAPIASSVPPSALAGAARAASLPSSAIEDNNSIRTFVEVIDLKDSEWCRGAESNCGHRDFQSSQRSILLSNPYDSLSDSAPRLGCRWVPSGEFG